MKRKVQTYRLKSLGNRLFGYAPLPDRGRAEDPLVRGVTAAVNGLLALDAHVTGGTPEAAHIALQIALRKARALADGEREALALDRRTFYSPPATSDQALDVELRAYVHALPDEARRQLMADAGRGLHPEVLCALARFPAPEPLAETARALLRAQREGADPDGAQVLRDREAALEWAESATQAVEGVLNDALLAGTIGAEPPV